MQLYMNANVVRCLEEICFFTAALIKLYYLEFHSCQTFFREKLPVTVIIPVVFVFGSNMLMLCINVRLMYAAVFVIFSFFLVFDFLAVAYSGHQSYFMLPYCHILYHVLL